MVLERNMSLVGVAEALEEGRRAPEARLWEAVLIRYARDCVLVSYAESARAWFASEDEEVGSFGYVCTALGLEPSAVRRALTQGCQLGKLDGSQRPDVHRLKLIGRDGGAPRKVRGRPRHGGARFGLRAVAVGR